MSDEQFKMAVKLYAELQRHAGSQHAANHVSIGDLQLALSRAGLALVPAADVERLAALEAQSKLYDQECGMCGSTAEALVEYQQWLESGKPTDAVTPEERAVLEAMKLVPVTWLEMAVGSSQITRGLAPLAAAELACRAAKGAKGG